MNDLVKSGIIDSYKTMKTAIEDAVSLSALILSTDCIIYNEVDYDRKHYNIAPQIEILREKFRNDIEWRAKSRAEYENMTKQDKDVDWDNII